MMRWAAIGAALVAVGGCGGSLLESDAPPDRIYTLQSVSPVESAVREPLDVRISVARPRVAPGLDTERIAVRTQPYEIDYYRAARWGDSTASVVRAAVVEGLRRSGEFALVAQDDSPAVVDYLLDLELNEFEAVQRDGAVPDVRLSLVATLIDIRSGNAIGSFDVHRESSAGANRLEDVVAALASAAEQAASELATRSAAALRSARAGAP